MGHGLMGVTGDDGVKRRPQVGYGIQGIERANSECIVQDGKVG